MLLGEVCREGEGGDYRVFFWGWDLFGDAFLGGLCPRREAVLEKKKYMMDYHYTVLTCVSM